jgi:hypothetical protein
VNKLQVIQTENRYKSLSVTQHLTSATAMLPLIINILNRLVTLFSGQANGTARESGFSYNSPDNTIKKTVLEGEDNNMFST